MKNLNEESEVAKVDLDAFQTTEEVQETHKVDLTQTDQQDDATVEIETQEDNITGDDSQNDVAGDDGSSVSTSTEGDQVTEFEFEEFTLDEEESQTEESETEAAAVQSSTESPELPENVESLVGFLNDNPGATIEDYVSLNRDVDSLSDEQLLLELHRQEEPGLANSDYEMIIADTYSVDEFADDAEKRKADLNKRRALAKAKKLLQEKKNTYFKEIKTRPTLSEEQQKAVTFFERYKDNKEVIESQSSEERQTFMQKTDELFSEDFKGFDFQVGEKNFRFKVKNVDNTKKVQSDIGNLTKKFSDQDNKLTDAKGYHKALFMAMHADKMAEHFYNQGKADAVKESASAKKQIDMGTRKVHTKAPESAGFKAKVVESTGPSNKLRIKQS